MKLHRGEGRQARRTELLPPAEFEAAGNLVAAELPLRVFRSADAGDGGVVSLA